MTKLARLASPLALLFFLSILLTACQSQPTPTPTQAPAKPTATGAPPAAAPAATAAPAASATEMDANQELRVNLGQEPPTLDPDLASWDQSISVLHQLFAGLLTFDEKLNLIPGIAKEVPTVQNGGISADGKTYTFKLRDNLKYSDGKPVLAKDIEYSLKRTLDPSLAAEYASFYYDVIGAEAYNTSKEKDPAKLQALRDAVGIKAMDDKTVVVTLKQARASFLDLATLWPMYPVREDVVKANSTGDKPDKWADDPKTLIGNGPFKMTEWVHQDHITLVPNENYYGPQPKLKKITLSMVADLQADYAAYLNGERDIALVPTALIDQIQRDPSVSNQVVRKPRLATFSIQFNNKQAPFDNPKVRRAFELAIDRQAFIDKLRKGLGKPAFSWIPPGMPGYQPDLGKEYGFDAAKAKQTLADAGYPGGRGLPKVKLTYPNLGNNPLYAQFFQQQWKDNLGVDVDLEPMEAKAASQAINKFQFQVAWFGWAADYPDPDNWLPELFGTDAGNNKTGYSNVKLDQLMKKAIAETDPQKRMQMWAEAQKTVVDDAPMAFVFHDEVLVLVKPYVKDIWYSGMDSNNMPGYRSYAQLWMAKH